MSPRALSSRLERLERSRPRDDRARCCETHADLCPAATGAGWRIAETDLIPAAYQRTHQVRLFDIKCGTTYMATPWHASGAPWETAFRQAGILHWPGTTCPVYVIEGVDLQHL